MSLQTPSMTGAAGDCCVEREGEVLTVPKPRAVRLLSVYLTVKPVGEPDALIGHVRCDERGWEPEGCRTAKATRPSSTLPKRTCRNSTTMSVVDERTWLPRASPPDNLEFKTLNAD